MTHGYEFYCPILIPEKKADRAERVDKKILDKYPMLLWGKDQKYRAKKAGKANFAYVRWGRCAVILHTKGLVPEVQDPDRFYHVRENPYTFPVGSWIEVKISPSKTGKRYTAYLTKQSYRNLKALLRENIEHRRLEVFEKYYKRLEGLPAFSGILGQMRELYRFCRSEIRKVDRQYRLKPLSLKKVY